MRKILMLVVLAIACSRSEKPSSVAPPPSAAQKPILPAPPKIKPPIERGAFVVEQQGTVLYREQFARSATRLETDVAASGSNERVLQVCELNPADASVRRTTVEVMGGATKSESMSIVIEGQQAAVRIVDRRGVASGKLLRVPPGTIPNPVADSLAILEQVIRRAKIVGGTRVEVPTLPGTLRPQRVFVTFTAPDAVRIESASAVIDAKIDKEGR